MEFHNQTFTIINRIYCNCDFGFLHNSRPLDVRFDNFVTRGIRAVTKNYFLSRDLTIDFYLFKEPSRRSRAL